jgi:serine/threonine protein kinase
MPERPPRPPSPVVEAETSRLGPRATPPIDPAPEPPEVSQQSESSLPAPGWMSGPLAASASAALSSSGGSPAISNHGSDGGGDRPSSGRPGDKRSSRPSGRPVNERVGEIVAERYKIARLLGEGGMGAVYEVEHTHMRKRFALKVLHADMSRLPEVVARFEREAMAAAHIDHVNVAAATDFGKLPDGSFFLVLEYVEGRSLRRVIDKEAPLEPARALHIVRQIALALERAHALGIVHRDLKPENVMLVERPGEPEVAKVLDFGIAKVPLGELLKNGESHAQPVLTQMGMVYGTPEYMAPEQALGQEVDARADLYALGAITFELLAGVRPYEADSKVALLGMHVTAPIPTIASKAPAHVAGRLAPSIEPMVRHLLAKEMVDRTASSVALVEDIDTALREMGATVAPLSGPSTGQMNRGGGSGSTPPRSLGPEEAAIANVAKTQRFTPVQQLAATELPPSAPHPPSAGVGGKWVAVGAAAAALALVVGAGAVFTLYSHRMPADDALADGGSVATAPSDSAQAATSGAASGTSLVPESSGDAGAGLVDSAAAAQHRAAAITAAQRKQWGTVVNEVAAAVRADPGAVQDDALVGLLRDAALDPKARESALGLAVTMGSRGGGLLYNVAYSPWSKRYPWSQGRAAALLASDPMRHQVAPEVDIALSLRELQPARTCDSPTLYPRAREVGDDKALAVLQGLAANKKLACLHQDDGLEETMTAIKSRLAAGAGKKP